MQICFATIIVLSEYVYSYLDHLINILYFSIFRNISRPGSQSPPLPPPPPPDDDGNQHFGRPRTTQGPLAPIVPDDQNLPGWVPKNYIEKGNTCLLDKCEHLRLKTIINIVVSIFQWLQFTIIMQIKTTN